MFGWMRIEQIASPKNFRPNGDVICDDTMPGLSQSLGNSRGASKPVQHGVRFYLLNQLKNVRQQLKF